jgi:N-acetylmuramoyl-L-alanine amidase
LLYETRKESLEGLDLGSVSGRKIVIDPGHGGIFRGAQGMGGLDEADVNLGVALYLWGLLEDAGAEVVLTRKTDRDFVEADSLRLREDLQARVEIVNQIQPHLLISLHHNSGMAVDTSFSEIQVYFKMGDQGPSLDVARIVARHLRTNLGETGTRVIPGNYYVLRNSTVPSILCETSYITNTQIESKLKLAEKQRLEAEVYFLALVDYFSRGIPVITEFKPLGKEITGVPLVEITFDPRALIDASGVVIELDGVKLRPFKLGLNHFGALPVEALRGGTHRVRARGRSIGGNSSYHAVWDFEVETQPAMLSVSITPDFAHPVFPQRIEATVLDRNAKPVKDSTTITFSWDKKQIERPTVDGKATVYINREIPFGLKTITAACAGLTDEVTSFPGERMVDLAVAGFVIDTEGRPIRGANLTVEDLDTLAGAGALAISDRDGYFVMRPGGPLRWLKASRQGYRDEYVDTAGDTYPVITLKRFHSVLTAGSVITLDPRGGGEDTGWVGPAGTLASGLNLAVAKRLAGMLSSAGITARLTRENDRNVARIDRVMRCEAWNSTLVISITHAGAGARRVDIGHYPGSRGGMRLADYLSEELGVLAGYASNTQGIDDYVILQTSCPAVKVTFLNSGTPEDEAELSDPYFVWNRAYAIFCAVARYLGLEEEDTFSVDGRVACGGAGCRQALVEIDGTFEMLSDDEGNFTVKLLERSSHTLQAFSASRESDLKRFDEATGFVEIELD